MRAIYLSLVLLISISSYSQIYPSYGSAIDVSINGLTFDAMEPFISPAGDVLFFNNLNDGVNTKLYYAAKINDSTFTFIGEVNGSNQATAPHLDAVADLDSLNNFYWTSTRNYPAELDNLFHGSYSLGNVTNIGRVHGDFNKGIPGWLVMDHGISIDGELLYFNNARFDGDNCQGPCETEMGIAQKVNDSTFNVIPNSGVILQNITDNDFNYYAPCISSDGLELYYTRFPRDTVTANTLFEICVAVRNTPAEAFSIPAVLFSELIFDLIEAPTLTTDKQVLYYHRKIVGSHKIVMRYRESTVGTETLADTELPVTIYPNPSYGLLSIQTELKYKQIELTILDAGGKEVLSALNQTQMDISSLPAGTYFLKIEIDGRSTTTKVFKIE